jgi:hypothetical protein
LAVNARSGRFKPVACAPIPEKLALWDRGYKDGRGGKNPRPIDQNPVYVLGWVKGNAALEEAENGCQIWGAPD